MTITKNQTIKNAYARYLNENGYFSLRECYKTYSYAKEKALNYCYDLMKKYNGYGGFIISYNIFNFTFGFIGEYEGKKAFFYITKDYDRVLILE